MDEPTIDLLARYRGGDELAATELFRRYVGRLTVLARARMSNRVARRFDPEDVVLSAYRTFFVRARNGQFTLEQSGDLWRLLVGIVLNKLRHQSARHTAGKRSVRREQALPAGGDSAWELVEQARSTPTAEQALELSELVEEIMRHLDARSRRVLELRLLGESHSEIAVALAVHERTVRRILDGMESQLRRALLAGGPLPVAPGPSDLAAEPAVVAAEIGEQKSAAMAPMIEKPRVSGVASAQAADGIDAPQVAGLCQMSDRDFVIELLLGRGGSGRVYRARRRSDGGLLAVKLIRKKYLSFPDSVSRFLREGTIVARLVHPGIVPILGAGKTRGGVCFLVYELVTGMDLASHAAAEHVAVAEALAWVSTAARALDYAHQQGVIHCDVKPSNLLLDQNRRVRVTDFGLARPIAVEDLSFNSIAGTIGYMAPEQLDRNWKAIGRPTDVFGIAAVLFTLLAGVPPFSGAAIDEVLQEMLTVDIAAKLRQLRPDVPAGLPRIIAAGLALSPANRPATALEFANQLDSVRRDLDSTAHRDLRKPVSD